ncbi:DUF998 domain-containing protein [Streptomyces sp. NPDC086023]|uniref:DUF998 domain-containing protein n=1 Tax=Streptomyces sp. NPDC086023 TaxID=3365746 RepID=UPI0037D10D11
MTSPNPTFTTAPTPRTQSTPATTRTRTRLLLTGGLAAGPLFLAAGIAQGLARDGFDFTRNAISQLALGSHGWIQTANFLLAAVLLTAAATGLHRLLRTAPAAPGPRAWSPSSAPRSSRPRSSRPTRAPASRPAGRA